MPVSKDGRKLPRDWEELVDSEGNTYYWHNKLDRTQYEFPYDVRCPAHF